VTEDALRVVVLLVAGAGAGAALSWSLRPVLGHPLLERRNHRGHHLPTAAGLCLALAVLAVGAVEALAQPVGRGTALVQWAVIAFAFLGLVDDLLGDGEHRGIRGHVVAALHGRVTTGFVKLAGGAAVAVVLSGSAAGGSVFRILRDAAVIALAANLGNLLDRAPGRVGKVGLLASVPVLVAGGPAAVALAPVAGAAAALLPGDLRERFMLGDTGANALGAAIGTAVVVAAGAGTRTVVAVVLLVLNLASEAVSFSRVIDSVGPLRAFDRLGRPPVGPA
jgi:UDP-N-acetylmuramyl pentapeptide phosphotransferase/UDP-N-acetylglucosamine-1-phosphate transferase